MKKLFSLCFLFLFLFISFGQNDEKAFAQNLSVQIDSSILQQYRQMEPYFQEAYSLHPTIPHGILEAIAFTYSRFCHLIPLEENPPSNCMPATYGVMGLTLDGRGYFKDNLHLVAALSGISEADIIHSPRSNILAYAAAFAQLQQQFNIHSNNFAELIPILEKLSELPDNQSNKAIDFARKSNLYAFCQFLNNDSFREKMHISMPFVPMEHCFGDMLPLLQSPSVQIIGNAMIPDSVSLKSQESGIPESDEHPENDLSARDGTDYPGAIWNPAASCNYSSRNGHSISAITIHYTQGTYAGSIAWFQNCDAQVSAHYVLRSSDGQITQMVREADKAWHVGNCNPYTIGLEHEAYGNIYSYFTPAMYEASADLTRNICTRNNIPPYRMFYRDTLDDGTVLNNGTHDLGSETSCVKIKGHQHFPGQSHTDPGPYWNWNYYFKLVNNSTPYSTFTTPTGTFTDSGGPDSDYGNDERKLYRIQVDGAQNIQLTFTDFELEDNYDFMWIYDGPSEFSPLIGRWNTLSPGTITSSGNALTIEFRSDCATTAAGWVANWTTNQPNDDDERPVTTIQWNENEWITGDFDISFQDSDNREIAYQFYQLMGNDGSNWTANTQRGFACDNFDIFNTTLWHPISGNWNNENCRLQQTSTSSSIIYIPMNENLSNAYLYDFYAIIPSSTTPGSRIEAIFQSNSTHFQNDENAYAVAILPADQQMKIYKIIAGSRSEILTVNCLATSAGTSYLYRILHDKATGTISVYRDGQLIGTQIDANPLTTEGNYFALGTYGTRASFDNLRIYRSRSASAHILVGAGNTNDLPWQASNGQSRAKVKSIVADCAGNFSLLQEKSLKVDYTPPRFRGPVVDGMRNDMDTFTTNSISAHWEAATDPNSGIANYSCFVVKNPLAQDSRGWMTSATSFTRTLRLSEGHRYYVLISAQNSAGLSMQQHSDGFLYLPNSSGPAITHSKALKTRIYPNPASEAIDLAVLCDTLSDAEALVFDANGKLIMRKFLIDNHIQIPINDWSKGVYFIQLHIGNQIVGRDKFIKK